MRPGRAAHQSTEVVAQQGPVVVDLPLQDDEQEEQPQQDVPQVAEDVVEGAGRGDTGRIVSTSGPRPPSPPERWAFTEPLPLALVHRETGKGGLARRFPPEVAQRVGTEEVVVADVLVPCDIYHLQ